MNETKYSTLYKALKDDILSGKYASGEVLPSENALTRRFKVCRSTVQQAFRELEKVGLISRRRGRGTFVNGKMGSRKIGLLSFDTVRYEFAGMMVRTVSALARKNDYTLLFSDFSTEDIDSLQSEAEKFVQKLVREGVSGVLYIPLGFCSRASEINHCVLNLLRENRIPVVLSDFGVDGMMGEYDVVGINNFKAGERVVDYLLSIGARRIDFWKQPHAALSHLERAKGARYAATIEHGRASRFRIINAEPNSSSALNRCFRPNRPDAIICANDNIAATLIKTLEKADVSVPDDVMIVAFDDIELARFLTPSLTTIHQPCEQIAEVAFRRLIDRVNDHSLPIEEIFLSAPLITRRSTRRSNQASKKRKGAHNEGKR